MGINFLLAPLYSIYLAPDEYGIIGLADIFNGFVAVLLSLGIKQAYARFFFDYYKKPKDLNALFTTSLFWMLSMFGIVAVVLYFVGDWLFGISFNSPGFSYSKFGWLILLSTNFTLINELFLSHYRNQENVKAYGMLSLGFFLTNLVCILGGVVWLEYGAMGNIAGRAIGSTAFMVLAILVYLFRNGIHIHFKFIKPMLEYGLPLIPYSLLLVAYNKIDRIMIDQFFDLDALGRYNFAFLMGTAISVVQYSVYNAINPRLFKLLSEKGEGYQKEVSQIHQVFQLFMMAIIVMAIAVAIPILQLLIDPKYFPIGEYIGLLFLFYFAQNFYIIYTLPLFYYKRTKVMPFISLIALVGGVIFNLVLIPPFGILGVCFAVIFTKYTQLGGALFFNRVYDYHKLPLFGLTKNVYAVAFITLSYIGVYLFLQFTEAELSYMWLNFLPLVLFGLMAVSVFNRQISKVLVLIRETLKGMA
ncbi:oligosaccharide flippase family protein [bacterium SCSIO 12741]|nr:oligosaccharide flippase family protein [bacterium SCSIO 12741]